MSVVPHPHHLVRVADVPSGSQWLGADERTVERALLRVERRREWRSGRWAAKQVLTTALGGALDDCARWQIIAADDGAPEVFLDGSAAAVTVSISHRAGWAAAVLSRQGTPVGIDLEVLEPRSERFVRDFFTDREVASYLGATYELRDTYAATVWSAKESILKCLRAGLRRDTRSVEVAVGAEALRRPRRDNWTWIPGSDLQTGERFDVWWMVRDDLLVTIAAPALRLAA